MPIRILLVDDHKIVREGTRQLLELSADMVVVAETANGEDAVRMCRELTPDVVVMDVSMPVMNGLEATRIIRSLHPDIQVVILTAHDDDRYIFPLLDSGAGGYLMKTASGEDLANAIRAVHRGEIVLDPQVSVKVRRRLSGAVPAYSNGLTERELEVVRAVARGKSNKEIGEALGIATYTVQVHLRNIFAKLEVTDRTQAVAYAIRHRWIVLDD